MDQNEKIRWFFAITKHKIADWGHKSRVLTNRVVFGLEARKLAKFRDVQFEAILAIFWVQNGQNGYILVFYA